MARLGREAWASGRLRGAVATIVAIGVVLLAGAVWPVSGARAEEEELLGIATLPFVDISPHEGEEVEAEAGEWGGARPITFRLQWLRCDEAFQHTGCTRIAGATEIHYIATTADIGHYLGLHVEATNAFGELSATNLVNGHVSARAPVDAEDPEIVGTPVDGETLHLRDEGWTGTEPIELQPQWMRCEEGGFDCVDIPGANGDDYTLRSGDVGSSFVVWVHARNSYGDVGFASTDPTSPVEPAAPAAAIDPQLYGSVYVGETISSGRGRWNGTTPIDYTVQWQRCDERGSSCSDITGATDWEYDVTAEDVGGTLRSAITATNVVSAVTAHSDARGPAAEDFPRANEPPAMTGTLRVGGTVTADVAEWEGATPMTFARQWLRCDRDGQDCAPIAGETGSTYELVAADFHHTLVLRVTATNGAGSATEDSLTSDVVRGAAENPHRFAFVRHRTQIWTADADGRDAARAFELAWGEPISELAISPDGDQVAFLVPCHGIEVASIDGSDRHNVVPAPCEEIISFAASLSSVEADDIEEIEGIGFTPDGDEVTFSAIELWERLYRVNTTTSDITEITTTWYSEEEGYEWFNELDSLPTFQPDGQEIAYISHGTGGAAIVLAEPNGAFDEIIDLGSIVDPMSFHSPPRFSADGRTLVFSAEPSGGSCGAAIWALDLVRARAALDAGEPEGVADSITRISRTADCATSWFSPSWEADGSALIVGSSGDSDEPTESDAIAAMDLSDGSHSVLVDGEGTTVATPSTPAGDIPHVSLSGLTDDTAYSDGSGTVTLLATAQDAALGIERLAYGSEAASPDATWSADCALSCPTDVEHEFALDVEELAEGAHPYVVTATNGAGTLGATSAQVVVDRTDPVAPRAPYVVEYDRETETAVIHWRLARDPKPEEDGVPAGIAGEEYRWRLEGGSWSEWEDASEGTAALRGLRANDPVEFEGRASDRAGNATTAEAVALEWTPPAEEEDEEEPIEAEFENGEGEEESFARRGIDPARECVGGYGRIVPGDPLIHHIRPWPEQVSGGGEPKAAIAAYDIDMHCPTGGTPDAAPAIKLSVCIKMWIEDESEWHSQVCDTQKGIARVQISLKMACRAGTQRYRIDSSAEVNLHIRPDLHPSGHSVARTYACNNAGAWRYAARMNTNSPSTTLGYFLEVEGEPVPSSSVPGPRNGFEAHHIVPWNYKQVAAGAQAVAWACGLGLDGNTPTVNAAANGVWLRGRKLAKIGDGGATATTSGYKSLRSADKRRAYHPTLHTRTHFAWIQERLEDARDGDNWSCDQGLAAVILAELKSELRTGSVVK